MQAGAWEAWVRRGAGNGGRNRCLVELSASSPGSGSPQLSGAGMRWRFQGNGSLVTVPWLPQSSSPIGQHQESTWSVSWYPLPLPLQGGGGEKTQCLHSTGHPPVTMATQQLAGEPAHQSCILLEHKGPRGPALRLNLRLSEMGMRSLWSLPPRLWPLSGPLCSAVLCCALWLCSLAVLSWPCSP